MKHRLAIVGLAVGLAGGAAAGVALGVPGLAGAQSPTTTAPSGSSGATPAPAPTPKADWIPTALAPLVSAGTITQAQADAVSDALAKAKPVRPDGGGRGGPGHRGGPGFGGGQSLEVAATAIGITQDELKTALESGQTIAAVAQSKGKEPQVVIDALVAAAKTRLDAEVAAGRITQAQADTRLTEETTRITDRVNNVQPARPDKPAAGSTTTTTG